MEDPNQKSDTTGFLILVAIITAAAVLIYFVLLPVVDRYQAEKHAKTVAADKAERCADQMMRGCPVTYLAPGGIVEDKGYRIIVGKMQLVPSDRTDYMKGRAPMFVVRAPNNQPVALSCVFLDRAGNLQGGGGGNVAPHMGSLMEFAFTSSAPGKVRCMVLK
jgi:uncharacterized protein YpmS